MKNFTSIIGVSLHENIAQSLEIQFLGENMRGKNFSDTL